MVAAHRPTPVFTGGTGRSGTTIVANLLTRHPEILTSTPREIRFLTDQSGLLDLVYGPKWALDRITGADALYNMLVSFTLRQNQRRGFAVFEKKLRGPFFERVSKLGVQNGLVRDLSREDLEAALVKLDANLDADAHAAAREFFFDIVTHQTRLEPQHKVWIDTTPLNVANADRTSKLLPEAKFIYMMRDGRETVASVMREPWGPNDPFIGLEWWARRTRASHNALQSVNPAQVLTMQLEDLVAHDREGSLAKLFHFVGLDEAPRVRKYFDEQVAPDRVRAGKWRDSISASVADRFDKTYRKIHANLSAQGVGVPPLVD